MNRPHLPHWKHSHAPDPESLFSSEWPARAEQERHRGTHFELNPRFVDDVGREKADAFLAILRDVGTRMHQHPRSEIGDELSQRFAGLGIAVAPAELDAFADEIARSEWVC